MREKNKIYLSVVIPTRNEEGNILELYNRLVKVLKGLKNSYEVIFVDDGSTDSTVMKIESVIKKDSNLKLIVFKRNFGKAAALETGFKYARGNYIITMDADLQDDPYEIPKFLKKMQEGFDVVVGWRFRRKDSLAKIIPSRFFNLLTQHISGLKIHDFNCGFKCYKREVVDSIDIYGELHRYIPVLSKWRGFSVGELKVKHHRRLYGKSKYGVKRLFKGFFDLITVKFLMSYGKTPLHLFGFIGFLSFFLGFVGGIYLVYDKFFNNTPLLGRPLLILVALLLILGMQLISIGLIGEIITSSFGKNNINRVVYEIKTHNLKKN